MLFTPNCLSPDQPHVGFPSELCPGNPRKAIRACVPWALAMSYASAAPALARPALFSYSCNNALPLPTPFPPYAPAYMVPMNLLDGASAIAC